TKAFNQTALSNQFAAKLKDYELKFGIDMKR
ncbi:MAG: hypothetical protein JWR67_3143, partial [Mucilaginibacter sp.]|nr:hypothetical protein [Mucilaginibacter sp.]